MCVTMIGKIILTILNTVFAMIALIMVILGCITLYAGDYILSFLDPLLAELRANGLPQATLTYDGFDIPAIMLNIAVPMIVCGCILFAIAFCGCCGANCENRILLIIYAAVIGVIIGGEIIAIIVIAGGQEEWKNQATGYINTYLEQEYQGSNGTNVVSLFSNAVYMNFNCCTFSDTTLTDVDTRFSKANKFDRGKSKYYIPEKAADANGPIKVPFTCCVLDQPFPAISPGDLNCGMSPTSSNSWVGTSCFGKLVATINNYQVYAIMGAIIVILVEVAILILTILICKSVGQSNIV